MTSATALSTKIKETLTSKLRSVDPEVQVSVKRTSLGWLKLRIITDSFRDKSLVLREQQVDNLLTDLELDLGQYPFVNYELLTSEEVENNPFKPIQLPLWSEILMAPEPDFQVQEKEELPHPHVVTFYSFKGGVGRTTALGLVAGILANRRRRVAIVDFDLEAPGLSYLFPIDSSTTNGSQYGVLDYLHQRTLTPDQNVPAIEDCIRRVDSKTRGDIYIVPAGAYNEEYIHRLADLSVRSLYQREENPVHQLIEDVKTQLEPDVILIDARTGFDDTGAIALLDLAHTAIVCFSPTDQTINGLRWIVQAAGKQQEYQGFPDLRFLLTPIPPFDSKQRQDLIARAEDWIEDNWGLSPDTPVEELYSTVSYNPDVAALSDLVTDVPESLLDLYEPIANVIDASLPDIVPDLQSEILGNREAILDELQFQAATAWELDAENISNFFQRTDDFPRFLDERVWLIRGAKGTGKSLLFRLFVEQSEDARILAEPYSSLLNVEFVPGHGPPSLSGWPILLAPELTSYEQQVGEELWPAFWLNYALLQLCRSQPNLIADIELDPELVGLCREEDPQHQRVISWLVERARSLDSYSKAIDELRSVDNWLQEKNRRVWLLYDELDASFGSISQDYHRRRRALNALFALWLESGPTLKSIVPKILLREDIWRDLDFTNKGHYATRNLELRWDEADLWRLVLRQVLHSSEVFANYLREKFGITVERLENSDTGQLRRSLYSLWGERMGAKKAYTYNWVRTRITDSRGNSFPRSLILLLEEGIRNEKGKYLTENISGAAVRPRALIDALPFVSRQRVDEVRNEYPEFKEYLDRLRERRSPIERSQLATAWKKDGAELERLIKDMVEAGILEQRSPAGDSVDLRYAVAELYLYGLDMVRKGQR